MPMENGTSSRPRIAIVGLWHLGVVTAACLAEAGFDVVAVDPDETVLAAIEDGRLPVDEPGLAALVYETEGTGRLRFDRPSRDALAPADIVWITFDTPVDDDDRADVELVLDKASDALVNAADGALVVLSSQLPVGSAREIERRMTHAGRSDLRFACVPENLRLGKALETFRSPDRFVAGVRSDRDRGQLEPVLTTFGRVEWMSVESAEMTKHALNAFLAMSVAFINEVATIGESVGADASQVARGLKSEQRIGPRAYVQPGDAFAGGTLARDIAFLGGLARRAGLRAGLVNAVATSNTAHRDWSRRTLASLLGAKTDAGVVALADKRIAVWGLTYKPGTNTLRRSSAVSLCRLLHDAGAAVRAYDPAVRELPAADAGSVELVEDPLAATQQADALVVCTPWPEFRDVPTEPVIAAMARPLILDPGGHLQDTLGRAEAVRYLRVGSPR